MTCLVGIDLLTKALAYLALPVGRSVRDDALFQIVLVLNRTAEGSWVSVVPTDRIMPLSGVGAALLCASGAAVVVTRLYRVRRPILACGATYLVAVAVAGLLWPEGIPGLSRFGSVLLVRFGQAVFFATCWWVSSPSNWRLVLLFFGAAASGNFLSLCIPPFAVADFLYSGVTNRALGFLGFQRCRSLLHDWVRPACYSQHSVVPLPLAASVFLIIRGPTTHTARVVTLGGAGCGARPRLYRPEISSEKMMDPLWL
jgi:hypothetical protein